MLGGEVGATPFNGDAPLARARSVMRDSLTRGMSIVDNLQKTIDSKNRACLDWQRFVSLSLQAHGLV